MDDFLKYGLIGTAATAAVVGAVYLAVNYGKDKDKVKTNVDVKPIVQVNNYKNNVNTEPNIPFAPAVEEHHKERSTVKFGWSPLAGTDFDYAENVPKLVRQQEKSLGCGYACVEALLNKAGKQITQKGLVQQAKDNIDREGVENGNLTAEEMQTLIQCNGYVGLVTSCSGNEFEESIKSVFGFSSYAVIGRGGHWVVVELEKDDDNYLIIHDPFFGKFKDGKSVPKRVLLSEFAENNKGTQWDILTMLNAN